MQNKQYFPLRRQKKHVHKPRKHLGYGIYQCMSCKEIQTSPGKWKKSVKIHAPAKNI